MNSKAKMSWIKYILSFFTQHDWEYYPKYIESVKERGRLLKRIDELKDIIESEKKINANHDLIVNFHKNELFKVKLSITKELSKKDNQLENLIAESKRSFEKIIKDKDDLIETKQSSILRQRGRIKELETIIDRIPLKIVAQAATGNQKIS